MNFMLPVLSRPSRYVPCIVTALFILLNLLGTITPEHEEDRCEIVMENDNGQLPIEERLSDDSIDSRDIPYLVDIPTFVSGDTWTYHGDTDTTGTYDQYDFSGTFTGDTTYTVDSIQTIVANGTEYMCYSIDLNGDFNVDATDGGVISISIVTDIRGTEYRCISDLSLVEREIIHNGTITINKPFVTDIVNYNTSMIETYELPLEEFDFPLFPSPDETWSQDFVKHSNSTGDVGGIPFVNYTKKQLKRAYSCSEIADSINAAGREYECHNITVKEAGQTIETRYYSDVIENLALTETRSKSLITIPELSISLKEGDIKLSSDPVLGEYGTVMTLETPFSVGPSSVIEVQGTIPGINSGQIDLEIPGESIKLTADITSGSFQKSIYLMGNEDNSVTITDIGSHGIIGSYQGNPPGYSVATVTVADPDVRVFDDDISYSLERENETDALVGETVTFSIYVDNPSLVEIENLRVRLLDNDVPMGNDIMMDVSPKDRELIESTWIPNAPGNHRIKVCLDPIAALNESYKHNNNATINLDVYDRPIPRIIDAAPLVRDIIMTETQNTTFSSNIVELPGGDYNTSWLIRRGNETEFSLYCADNLSCRFTASYIGENSNSKSPFTIKFSVTDDAAYVRKENSTTWNVTVNNVNRAPRILNAVPDPNAGTVNMNENESHTFRIIGEDPDGTIPEIMWKLNGEALNVSASSYIYATDYFSSGNHTLEAILIDADDNTSKDRVQWNVQVMNINRPCHAVIQSPLNNSEYEVGTPIFFSANGSFDPDIIAGNNSNPLSYHWDFGDEHVSSDYKVNYNYSKTGKFTVMLRVHDGEGSNDTITITITIIPTTDSDGDGYSDTVEKNEHSDPYDKKSTPMDRDGDGHPNNEDYYPDDAGKWIEPGESEMDPMTIPILSLMTAGILLMIATYVLLQHERKKKKLQEMEKDDQKKMEKGGLVSDLVELERYQEEIRENIGRIDGRLKQLQWDMEDGQIDQRRYNDLATRYRNSQRHLRDEMRDVENRINYLEIQLEREKKPKEKRGRYGGAGLEDFQIASYGDTDEDEEMDADKFKYSFEYEEEEDDYDDDYGEDGGEEIPGKRMEQQPKGRYGGVYQEYLYVDSYSEYEEEDDYDDEYEEYDEYDDDDYYDEDEYEDDY